MRVLKGCLPSAPSTTVVAVDGAAIAAAFAFAFDAASEPPSEADGADEDDEADEPASEADGAALTQKSSPCAVASAFHSMPPVPRAPTATLPYPGMLNRKP